MAYLISEEANDLLQDVREFCENEVKEQIGLFYFIRLTVLLILFLQEYFLFREEDCKRFSALLPWL